MAGQNVESSARERFRYWFDGFMAKGSSSAFIALTIVFLALFFIISVLRISAIAIAGDVPLQEGEGFWRQIYITFLEITDPGSMTQDVHSSPVVKIFAVLAGMSGIVLLSALIAFVTTALDQRLNDLRKGHSKVIEDEHSLILGWNDRILDILKELILANESEESASVVILAEKDKEEMDDFLGLNLPDRLTTKVVTRSGSPSSLVNLNVASADTARSVIVLASADSGGSQSDRDRSDMTVIKSVLAMRQLLEDDSDAPVVAEIFNEQRRALARSLDPKHVVCLDADDVLAKILVQTSRSEGLAVVYEEMLSFDGAEMYFYGHPWNEMLFGTATYHLPDGVPVGILGLDGEVELNPNPSRPLVNGEELLILATDDSAIAVAPEPVAYPIQIVPSDRRRAFKQERELIIGWTPKLETLVREYSDYVGPGSQIDIVLRNDDSIPSARIEKLNAQVENIALTVSNRDPFDSEQMSQLEPGGYDNIIVLSESGAAGGSDWADAETLLILIQLQELMKTQTETRPTLIAEVLDSKNRELVNQTGISEFIISNRLISMLAAQMSEDAKLFKVYDTLFSEDGAEVYLKPLSLYFETVPPQLRYIDMIAAAQQRGETALGWRRLADSDGPESNFGVRLIPPKDEVQTFTAEDFIVVMAEDET